MPDILVSSVSAEDIGRLDQQASDLGMSRDDYLRLAISRIAYADLRPVTVEDLRRVAYLARDLLDEDVMRGAWK